MQGFKPWRWKVWAVRQPHSVDCRFVEQRLHDILDGNSWTFCQLRETVQCTLWNSWTLHTWILQHQLNLTLIRVNITLLSKPNIIRISYSSSSSHTSSTSSSMPPRMDKLKTSFMFLNAPPSPYSILIPVSIVVAHGSLSTTSGSTCSVEETFPTENGRVSGLVAAGSSVMLVSFLDPELGWACWTFAPQTRWCVSQSLCWQYEPQ